MIAVLKYIKVDNYLGHELVNHWILWEAGKLQWTMRSPSKFTKGFSSTREVGKGKRDRI